MALYRRAVVEGASKRAGYEGGPLGNRLFAAIAIGAAAFPVISWPLSLAWLACGVGLATLEAVAPNARWRRAIETLSRLNYIAAAILFWNAEAPLSRLLAVVIVVVDLLWLLMKLHARPRMFLATASPLLAVALAGAADVVRICIERGEPWMAVTALMGPMLMIHFVILTRGRLARSHEALAKAQDDADAAARAKSFFLATMSHEIRTPLNGVLGMAQAMQADRLSPVQRERLQVIRQSGQALASILDDVLDLSTIEAGRLQLAPVEFDAAELARAALAPISPEAAAKRLTVRLRIEPGADGIYRGDARRLRQVLGKLLSNAVKFTAAGEVELALARYDGRLCFAVRDTGQGIDQAQLGRLFERFEQVDASPTRRHGGAGLGLSIAREIAQLMGAEIEVSSRPGEGSTFTLAAPLPRIGDATPVAQSDFAELDLSDVRLLAAEDNPMNQLVLKTLLGQHGLDPVLVETGAQALAAWRTGGFDVILMDVQMPEMDGPAAARAIRTEEAARGLPRTPIVALTANAMSHQVEEYFAAGMDLHVAKPIEAGLLYDAIIEALNSRETRTDSAAA
ncbi:ATP-binding protein [Phenylobacterium sp.]|jgi:signal transduction histidine kinase/ActR/RegA family two-component response regulator|uniref:ATP-binding protein n=1 Tax=Phenylobacterium sp. TaxID=1871053 RepID=UPI002E358BBF|nr:ATP-binding protein [Phenylobacterium sp.]HEX2560717.1 ATP-binding protein [Phenylobacterium sp.]